MSLNSGFIEAPPTRKPSMSGQADSSGAFFAFAGPPDGLRIPAATSGEAFLAISARMPA